MAQSDSIQTVGTIQDVLPGPTFRAELANGHIVRAHIPEKSRPHLKGVAPGVKVALELSPYDFSIARITSIL